MRRFLTVSNLARLALLLVFAFTLHQLDEMKPPSKTVWARHLAEGKSPTVAEHVQVGLWYGAVARAGLSGLLLLVSLAWPVIRPVPTVRPLCLDGVNVPPRVFWTAATVIVLGALCLRLPRMTQSFWGDEADAVASYVHGQWRPLKKKDPQGALFFEQPDWGQTFFSAKHGPNNHVLFSITSRLSLGVWQKWTGKRETDFTEWPMRVPSLLAGLGSLVALACLMRRWGAPVLGLFAAAFLAVHPWHVRYSTEARGYGLALCLLPLVLIALTDALEKRGWWRWLVFALAEFLLMYSWAGIAYPLAFINLAALCHMLTRADRWMLLVRWGTASLLAAAAFISLYAPQLPQIRYYNATHLWMKGLPMDEVWLHNLLAAPFTGMAYHGPVSASSVTLNWQRLLSESPVLTIAGFGLIIIAFAVGLACLWRRQRVIAGLLTSVIVAAAAAALHFKFFIGDELRVWYLIFTLPVLAVCVATGLEWMAQWVPRCGAALRGRTVVVACLFTVIVAALWPMNGALMTHPAEDFKNATAVTRGKHEIFDPKGRAEVFTCWLWRFSALYDPRGEIHVRDEASLRQRMEEARAAKAGLFIILGYRQLAEQQNAAMLRLLEDTALFERTAHYPAYDPIQTLEVYRMKAVP